MGRNQGSLQTVQASGFTAKPSLTVATSNNVAYTSGDQVGVLMTLDQIPIQDGADVTITDIVVIDKDLQNAKLIFYFFRSSVTAVADNAPAAISAADLIQCDGKVVVLDTDYSNLNANSVATVACRVAIQSAANSQIYVMIKTESTPTYQSTSGLVVKFGCALDFK